MPVPPPKRVRFQKPQRPVPWFVVSQGRLQESLEPVQLEVFLGPPGPSLLHPGPHDHFQTAVVLTKGESRDVARALLITTPSCAWALPSGSGWPPSQGCCGKMSWVA